jgi:hypothetical protein
MNPGRVAVRLAGTIVLAGLLFVTLAGVLFVGCARLFGDSFDMCGNTVLRTVPSPDGRLKAVVFERDCGATTGFSTQVSVLGSNDKLPNEAGNLFVAAGNPSGPGGGPWVKIAWSRDRELLVRYDHSARIYESEKQLKVRSGLFGSERISVRYK